MVPQHPQISQFRYGSTLGRRDDLVGRVLFGRLLQHIEASVDLADFETGQLDDFRILKGKHQMLELDRERFVAQLLNSAKRLSAIRKALIWSGERWLMRMTGTWLHPDMLGGEQPTVPGDNVRCRVDQ